MTVNVAMAIQAFAPTVGGGELQLERLLPHLRARDVRSVVLTRAVRGAPRRDVVGSTDVYRTPVGGESPVASVTYVAASFAYLVRRWRTTDVVHAHGALSPATIGLAARVLGKPCVVTVLGAGPPGDLARLERKFAGRRRLELLARHARFVALSAEVRDELQHAGVPSANVTLVPNGVDVSEYRPATAAERAFLRRDLGLAPDRCYGVFVGRLHPVKSVDTLLRALVDVPAIDLLVVGDGTERAALETLAREHQIGERVRFVGMSDRVPDYLRAADAFFLPSLGEGMSNALLEAMACGLPCVVTEAVGGIDELLGRNRGVAVPVQDVRAWADAMRRLADDPARRAELGSAAARYVGSTLSIDATADRLADLYRELAMHP